MRKVERVRLVATISEGKLLGEMELDLTARFSGKSLEEIVAAAEKMIPRAPSPKPRISASFEPIDAPEPKPFKLGPELVIGRSRLCDVPLRSPKVSRQHVRVRAVEGGHVIEDLDSANHTFVNGERVEKRRRLEDGDEVLIGDNCSRYRRAG